MDYDAVMYILWFVAAVGMFSYGWGRVCRIMFICSTTYILAHHLLLTPWPFDLKYLGYFGALMSCCFGIMISRYYAIPADLPHREQQHILLSVILIGLLYLLAVIITFYNQFAFNSGLPEGSTFPTFAPAITALHIVLIAKGGWDGASRIVYSIVNILSHRRPYSLNMENAQEIHRKREEI